MRIVFFLFLMFVSLGVSTAHAQSAAPVITGDYKDLKHTSSARIDKVIDGQTILMKDGKVVRLSGVFYPFASGEATSTLMIEAKKKLERVLPENTEVMLYQTRYKDKGRMNRMGHELAHLVIKKTGEWVNGAMVAYGYAYALTDIDAPQMVSQLYGMEETARTKKRGLLSDDSAYKLLSVENAAEGEGTFRVVEGTISKVSTFSNNLYLNFGEDWRKDFTIKISAAQRRLLSRQGIDPMALAERRVRARGWLREWNGPFMELESVDQLEIVAFLSPVPENTPETAPEATPATRQLNP